MAATCLGMVVGSQVLEPLFRGETESTDTLLGLSLLSVSFSNAPSTVLSIASLSRQSCHCQSQFLQFSGHWPPGAWQKAGRVWLVPCSPYTHFQKHT